MKNKKRMNLNEGDVKRVLIKLTIPMIFGMLGLVVFNLVDTVYISNYSNTQMAAMAYTLPVVLMINSLILGIGVGTSAAVSKAKGEGKHHLVQRYASDSLLFGLLLAIVIIALGFLTMKPLFTLVGADEQTLPYVIKYMRIWYLGVPFVVIPMIGNNSIRGLGDTKTPSLVMAVAATVNIGLDPVFIFGLGPVPELGIAGAALATVISRFTTFTAALYVLGKREKVLSFKNTKPDEIVKSWSTVLYVGLPNAITRMVIPAAGFLILPLLSTYGNPIVSGYGVVFRIEQVLLVVLMAFSVVMGPFVGQNYGSKDFDRIEEARKYSVKFAFVVGAILYVFIFFMARPIATLFLLGTPDLNDKEIVIREIVLYLRIVPLAYAFQAIYQSVSTSLNSLRKPFIAATIGVLQMLGIYVPLAYLGSRLFGYVGVFIALAIAYFAAGVVSFFVLRKEVDILAKKENIRA